MPLVTEFLWETAQFSHKITISFGRASRPKWEIYPFSQNLQSR